MEFPTSNSTSTVDAMLAKLNSISQNKSFVQPGASLAATKVMSREMG